MVTHGHQKARVQGLEFVEQKEMMHAGGEAMINESELEILFLDTAEDKTSLRSLKGKDLTDQIDKLKRAIEYMLRKMEKLGKYELSEFTATAGIELGAWIFKADGSISMKWTKPAPSG